MHLDLRTLLVVLVLYISQISCSGKFKLELIQFNNDYGLLDDDTCCQGQLVDNICTEQCNTYFSICFKHYQREVTAGSCTYGEHVTKILGNNSFQFPSEWDGLSNPLDFPFGFAWKGDFSLIIQAYHESSISSSESSSGHRMNENRISQFNGSATSLPADGWSQHRWNSTSPLGSRSLQFRYKVECDTNFYGSGCSLYCVPRNDQLGHYECDASGERVCRQGWQGEYCDKAICLEGCHTEHGHCSRPNECSCNVGWGGRFCDLCLTYPGCDHGYCVDKFDCICYEGWGGVFCNQDLNYCTNNRPCRNGGTCSNTGEGSYTCSCPVGYTGVNCEIEVDNCQIQPCENGGECRDIGNDFVCECLGGFAGSRCEVEAARCNENPCANGGTCEPIGSSYRCHCVTGWGGVNCLQQRNECDSSPCQNGGSCVDQLNGYRCTCPQGFSGTTCEVNRDECAGENPCLNGGNCVDGDNSYRCYCRAGFIGGICETNVDDCLTRPCANGGTCQDGVNDYECFCAAGYTGRMCNEEINECASNPCQNGASCEDRVNGFECHCPPDKEGTRCQYKLGEAPPAITRKPTTTPTTLIADEPVKETNRAASTSEKEGDGKTIVFTRTQLILVVCFGSGIPLCLLLLFVSILLYRRWKKKTDARSEETRQNEANNMNNRIHNDTSFYKQQEIKKSNSSYPTEKSINDMEIPPQQQQLQMSYRNSASPAAFPDKLSPRKDYIKNVNAANDHHLSQPSDSLPSIATSEHLKLYSCQRQQLYDGCRSNSLQSNSTCTSTTRSGGGATPSAQTYTSCSRPATKQNNNSGSANTISTISSAVIHTPSCDAASAGVNCDSSYRSQSLSSQLLDGDSSRDSSLYGEIDDGADSCVSGYVTNSPSPCPSPQLHLPPATSYRPPPPSSLVFLDMEQSLSNDATTV